MSRLLKIVFALAIVAAVGFGILYMLGDVSSSEKSADSYKPSDEIIYPSDISKNAYALKGHSGILDTVHVPLLQRMGGQRVAMPYPGGCLKFEKMIDEHTATFEVLVVGEYGVEPDGEIAVDLDGSEPPDSTRPWRVFVEGSRDGVNGLGAKISVTAVKFEGYTTFPAPRQGQTQTQSIPIPPAPTSPSDTPAVDGQSDADGTKSTDGEPQPAAPIERRPPPPADGPIDQP